MKLLLSDSSDVDILNYENHTVVVDGCYVDGIVFEVANSTLEIVKATFKSGNENLSTMHILNDDGDKLCDLIGYQTRKSIEIGENDTYIVTLLKTSNLELRMGSLEKFVKDLSFEVRDVARTHTEIVEALQDIKNIIGETKENYDRSAKSMAVLEQNVSTISNSQDRIAERNAVIANQYDEMKNKMDETREAFAKITDSLGPIDNLVSDLREIHRVLNDQADETKEFMTTSKETLASNESNIKASLKELYNYKEEIDVKEKKIAETANVMQTTVDELKESANIAKESANAAQTAAESADKRVADLLPPEDITILPIAEVKLYRIAETQSALSDFLDSHPIASKCHKGNLALYSISADKQAYLQAMIMLATTAAQNGIAYQPSWNSKGHQCTYDWTVEELQQLAVEIEATVRPLISHQQHLEAKINSATSVENVMAIEISYEGIEPNKIELIPEPPAEDAVTNDATPTPDKEQGVVEEKDNSLEEEALG